MALGAVRGSGKELCLGARDHTHMAALAEGEEPLMRLVRERLLRAEERHQGAGDPEPANQKNDRDGERHPIRQEPPHRPPTAGRGTTPGSAPTVH